MAYRFSWSAGAAAILLALVRMQRLLRAIEDGPPWQLALLAGASPGAVITWTAVSYRVGWLGTLLLNLGGLALAAFRLGAADTLLIGILPSLDTFPTIGTELKYAIELIRFGAAPVFPAAGLILVLTAVFWVLGAFARLGDCYPTIPPWGYFRLCCSTCRSPPSTAYLLGSAGPRPF